MTTKKTLKRQREESDSDTPTDEEQTTTTTTTTTTSTTKDISDDEQDLDIKLKKSKPLTPVEKISNLLEIVNADKLTYSDFQSKFREMATQLQNDVILFVNEIPHVLCELEYYYKSNNHPDNFTHCDVFQKEFGSFYFHRNGNTYKSGTYKGLDITFGSKQDNVYAGILIRALEQVGDKLIDGPSLVVDHVLKLTKHSDILDFVKENGLSLYEGKNPKLYIKMREDCTEEQLKGYKLPPKVDSILECGRVGLTLKRYFINAEYYITRHYRFLRHPDRISKGKPYMILSELLKNKSQETIRRELKSTAGSIKNIKEQFEAGKKEKSNKIFRSDLSKGLLPQLFGYATTLKYIDPSKKMAVEEDDEQEQEDDDGEEDEDN